MAYIELHQEFRDHTKVKRLATALDITRAEARSMMVSLWLWAAGEARSGDITKFTPAEIADACHSEEVFKSPDPKRIHKALIDTEIIDERDSKCALHDWKKHGVRILENSRKRTAKYRREHELGERTVTSPKRDGSVLLSFFLSLFPSFSQKIEVVPGFKNAWGEWVEFRRKEKRKAVTDTQAVKQIKWLLQQPDPVACIEKSMRQGWTGLFEIEAKRGNSPPVSAGRRSTYHCPKCDTDHPVSAPCAPIDPKAKALVDGLERKMIA